MTALEIGQPGGRHEVVRPTAGANLLGKPLRSVEIATDTRANSVDAIKAQVRARVTLLTCDAYLNYGCPWTFEPWDEFKFDVEIRGGGGTSFRPVFEWVDAQDNAPGLLVYFTDAEGVFPAVEPDYPVTWLVKGKAKVPFGQRIQLN